MIAPTIRKTYKKKKKDDPDPQEIVELASVLPIYQDEIKDKKSPTGKLAHFSPYWYLTDEMKKDFFSKWEEVSSTDDDLYSLVKLTICYRLNRKYNKIYGTYLNGLLTDNDKYTPEPDDKLITTNRFWNEEHEKKGLKKIRKSYQKFHVCEKKSRHYLLPGIVICR